MCLPHTIQVNRLHPRTYEVYVLMLAEKVSFQIPISMSSCRSVWKHYICSGWGYRTCKAQLVFWQDGGAADPSAAATAASPLQHLAESGAVSIWASKITVLLAAWEQHWGLQLVPWFLVHRGVNSSWFPRWVLQVFSESHPDSEYCGITVWCAVACLSPSPRVHRQRPARSPGRAGCESSVGNKQQHVKGSVCYM